MSRPRSESPVLCQYPIDTGLLLRFVLDAAIPRCNVQNGGRP